MREYSTERKKMVSILRATYTNILISLHSGVEPQMYVTKKLCIPPLPTPGLLKRRCVFKWAGRYVKANLKLLFHEETVATESTRNATLILAILNS